MKTLTKAFIITLLGATLLQAAAFTQNIHSHGVNATVSSNQALSAGSNTIVVKLDGAQYKDAKVKFRAFMPAMPGMPAMKSIAKATSIGDGKYKAKLNLAMAGTWQLFIYITTKNGQHKRVKTFLNF